MVWTGHQRVRTYAAKISMDVRQARATQRGRLPPAGGRQTHQNNKGCANFICPHGEIWSFCFLMCIIWGL